MAAVSDRLLVLLIAATGLLVLFVGWELALVEAIEVNLAGWVEAVLFFVAFAVFVVLVFGVWATLKRIDQE
ncbi:hypothetical protein [Natrialba aegyptia]|uniref:Uncharacterized protein n=1 Tax=Natrialba aegyptia DSM 13077 TaxID=1227491 RepID=M0B9D8_9EURY|nr:hypothetical protein [Natrialba aegyptia]ELZ06918.1 hypothetical protein C480_07822 [Natrialba aegyptia DSM 13077]